VCRSTSTITPDEAFAHSQKSFQEFFQRGMRSAARRFRGGSSRSSRKVRRAIRPKPLLGGGRAPGPAHVHQGRRQDSIFLASRPRRGLGPGARERAIDRPKICHCRFPACHRTNKAASYLDLRGRGAQPLGPDLRARFGGARGGDRRSARGIVFGPRPGYRNGGSCDPIRELGALVKEKSGFYGSMSEPRFWSGGS